MTLVDRSTVWLMTVSLSHCHCHISTRNSVHLHKHDRRCEISQRNHCPLIQPYTDHYTLRQISLWSCPSSYIKHRLPALFNFDIDRICDIEHQWMIISLIQQIKTSCWRILSEWELIKSRASPSLCINSINLLLCRPAARARTTTDAAGMVILC